MYTPKYSIQMLTQERANYGDCKCRDVENRSSQHVSIIQSILINLSLIVKQVLLLSNETNQF